METALYNELNIIALLRQRALFVPAIYATGERTIRIGHRYGMPKQPASMQVRVDTTRFEAQMMDGACESFARARLLGSGRGVAQMVSRLWPRQLWPARFPIGTDGARCFKRRRGCMSHTCGRDSCVWTPCGCRKRCRYCRLASICPTCACACRLDTPTAKADHRIHPMTEAMG